jgi:transaldolase
MINKPALSLLEQHEASHCKVDVDCCDPEIAKSLPFVPHDMTSNQILIHERLMAPENKELVEKTIRELKGADWLDVHIALVSQCQGGFS